jgi:hypothetical protein
VQSAFAHSSTPPLGGNHRNLGCAQIGSDVVKSTPVSACGAGASDATHGTRGQGFERSLVARTDHPVLACDEYSPVLGRQAPRPAGPASAA